MKFLTRPSGANSAPIFTSNFSVSSKSGLMLTGAAGAVALSLAASASAQVAMVPPECTITPSPLASGSTILCVSPTPIGPIDADVDDLTIVVGDPATPTTIQNGAGNAIFVRTMNGGVTIDTTNGNVAGYSGGIDVRNNGTGLLSLTTGDVTATQFDGIAALSYSTANTDGVMVNTTAGTVAGGGRFGIFTRNNGSGDTVITTADVTSNGPSGVYSTSGPDATGDTLVDTSAGAVFGTSYGTRLINQGSGDIVLTTGDATGGFVGIRTDAADGNTIITLADSAAVTGQGGSGIRAYSTGADASITIDGGNGSVAGVRGGLYLSTQGGDISVDGFDSISAQDGRGIRANSQGGDISIQGVGTGGGITVTNANSEGILADAGGGDISIGNATHLGDIVGGRRAIQASTRGDGNVLIDTRGGTVSSFGTSPVAVFSSGTGSINILTADVTELGGFASGVFISTSTEGDSSIDTTAGSVTAGFRGLLGVQNGTGSITITSADVTINTNEAIFGYFSNAGSEGAFTVDSSAGTVSSTGSAGIRVFMLGSGATTLTIDDVSGGTYGIQSQVAAGTTQINLTSTADIVGGSRAGILASSTGADGHIGIQGMSGNVTGATDGMDIDTVGANITVQDLDNVTGQNGDGIDAASSGGDISITNVGTVLGTYGNGILAQSNGGNISVQGSGLAGGITGTGGNGILAIAGGGDIDIGGTDAIGDVTGSQTGIAAQTTGAGNVTIDSSAGTVIGGDHGILVDSAGSGSVSLVTADVTGTGQHGLFIRSTGGIAIDSTAGSVTGSGFGISATNMTAGDLSITTGDVTGNNYSGIAASNSGGALTVDSSTGGVEGVVGVDTENNGTGALTITTGDVTGTVDEGIGAINRGADLTINSVAGSVLAQGVGVRALNYGSGNLSITSADITSTGSAGIFALNDGEDLIIDTSAGAVVGAADLAIFANNRGTGDLTVTTADLTGAVGDGLQLVNNGSNLTIDTTAGTVTGQQDGIQATNYGTGALSITTADVTGTDNLGIFVRNGATAGDLNVDTMAGVVAGNTVGIYADQQGMGSIAVTTADVISLTDDAIRIEGRAATVNLSVDTSAGTVTGGADGISAVNRGTGGTSIVTADVSGAGGVGILGFSINGSVAVDIGGDVTGAAEGVLTLTENGTQLILRDGHSVTGGNGVAIATLAAKGSTTSDDTLGILGTANGAILTGDGDDIVTLADSGVVSGAIMLGNDTDTLTLESLEFGMARGGDGLDTVNFAVENGVLNNSGDAHTDTIAEFEEFNINADGFALVGAHTGLNTVNFNSVGGILMGSLASNDINVTGGSSLFTSDGSTMTGNLTNSGVLDLNMGGTGALAVDGDFTQTGGGSLDLSLLSAASSDALTVTGDIDLGGTLNLTQATLIQETVTLVDGSGSLVGEFFSVTGLQNGLLLGQSIEIDTANADVNLVSRVTDAAGVQGLTTNQRSAANSLTSAFAENRLVGPLRSLTLGLGLLNDENALASALDELSPEIASANIDGLRARHGNFRNLLLERYHTRGAAALSEAEESRLGGGTPYRGTAEGAELWGAVTLSEMQNDGTTALIGYESDGVAIATGISNIDVGGAKLGFAFSFSEFDTTGLRGNPDTATSDIYLFGTHLSTAFGGAASGINGHIDLTATYGSGQNDLTMNSAGPLLGFGSAQSGSADFTVYGTSAQVTLDGTGGSLWPIRPFVSVAYDNYSQDALTLRGTGPSGVIIGATELERVTFGYGARFVTNFGGTQINLGATGYHFTGDTEAALSSNFFNLGQTSTPFTTGAFDIESQFKLDGTISQSFGDGWKLSAGGFAEFGDLEGFGGTFKVSVRF